MQVERNTCECVWISTASWANNVETPVAPHLNETLTGFALFDSPYVLGRKNKSISCSYGSTYVGNAVDTVAGVDEALLCFQKE